MIRKELYKLLAPSYKRAYKKILHKNLIQHFWGTYELSIILKNV